MSEKAAIVFALLIGGAALVAARRWKNSDPDAGVFIAFFVMLAVLTVLR